MSGSCREALSVVLEALPDVRVWSGGPLRYPECSEGPPGCPGEVGRPSQMSGSGREALPYV